MGKVFVNITMSLDGFIAGPNISLQNPLGEGGIRLHNWMFDAKTAADALILDEITDTTGAVILGRRTYADAIDDAWEGVTPFKAPAFVLANTVPQRVAAGFTFVTAGIESALAQATAVAGDKNVWVMGGAAVIQQFIKAHLLDELQISIAPVLFAAGTPLFEHIGTQQIELQSNRVIQTPQATHIRYTLIKQAE